MATAKVHFPSLKLVRFIGETPTEVWQIPGREKPLVEKGDLILMKETVALRLSAGYSSFKMVDVSDIEIDVDDLTLPESGESNTEPVDTEPVDTEPVDTEPVDTEPVDTKKLPYVDELNNFSKAELIEFSKYVGLPTNKRSKEVLKKALKAYCPVRSLDDSQ